MTAPTVSIVDGNAIAGMLEPAFGTDPTLVRIECAHCGRLSMLAETVVEREARSAIVRCRSCTRTMLTLREDAGELVVRMSAVQLHVPG